MRHVKIHRNTKAKVDLNKAISYFQSDSWSDLFAVEDVRSAIIVVVQVVASKSVGLAFAFEFGVAVMRLPAAVMLVSTRFEFCSCLRHSFEVGRWSARTLPHLCKDGIRLLLESTPRAGSFLESGFPLHSLLNHCCSRCRCKTLNTGEPLRGSF